MEIKGKVHCFFEQSGTFKNEFKKLGYDAYDYDIQNNFGETDYVIDLFNEIENAYDENPSIFDDITSDDLVLAFFPCIYFCAMSQVDMYFSAKNYRKMSQRQKTDIILERNSNREMFYRYAVKMISVCIMRNIPIIMENPWSMQTFLKSNFVAPPTIIDNDRSLRGDYFKKPTAYWFFNCEPTYGKSIQKDKSVKRILDCSHGIEAGMCSEERSMISPDYARNFICDFIIGKKQNISQLTLF